MRCMWRALSADHLKLWPAGEAGIITKVEEMLDIVGTVLDETSRLYSSAPVTYVRPVRYVFMNPRIKASSPIPLTSPDQLECMFFVEREVIDKKHMLVDGDGYLQLTLAYDRVQGTIREGAHRFVLWSIFGPPPNDEWVVMHYCCHAACLNPFHMVWGTRGENLLDAREAKQARRTDPRAVVTAAHAERRIVERFRQA